MPFAQRDSNSSTTTNNTVSPSSIRGFAACLCLSAAQLSAQFSAPLAAQVAPPPERTVAFVNVSVVPMDRERVLTNQTVIVRNGRIERVGPSASVSVPAGADTVDGRGKFLMPGLSEFHAHVPPANAQQALKDRVLALYVVNGVTTARSMLGDRSHLALRARIARGEELGPRIIAAGPSFNANSARTPQEAIDSVKSHKAAGYDLLKIHPGVPRVAYDSMVATAKRLGIPFAGHVPLDVGWQHATSTGYSTIDHNDGLIEALTTVPGPLTAQQTGFFGLALMDNIDESRIPRLVSQAKAGKVWLVPTAALLDAWVDDTPPSVLAARDEMKYWLPAQVASWTMNKTNTLAAPENTAERRAKFVAVRRRALTALHRGGVPILLGSDAPQVWNVPGFSVHRELQALVAAGLTPYEAIRTGTANVAAFLNESERSGTVAEGRRADLILLAANPLADIRNTQAIQGVMVQGRWLSKAAIEGKLAALRN